MWHLIFLCKKLNKSQATKDSVLRSSPSYSLSTRFRERLSCTL